MANRTGYQVKNEWLRSVHDTATHPKVHTMYNILIFEKLWYLATLWSQRCQILQLLLFLTLNNMTWNALHQKNQD